MPIHKTYAKNVCIYACHMHVVVAYAYANTKTIRQEHMLMCMATQSTYAYAISKCICAIQKLMPSTYAYVHGYTGFICICH